MGPIRTDHGAEESFDAGEGCIQSFLNPMGFRIPIRILQPVVGILVGVCVAPGSQADVTLMRVPDGGIQPQVVSDAAGTLHLLYFKGGPSGGDLFYVHRPRTRPGFSRPIRVNSEPGSAIAIGTIRGGQLALGEAGRVHMAWNGHAPQGGTPMQAPMLYTRLNDSGTGFEPERDVIQTARGLDGGGSVAADSKGTVVVAWHAPRPGNTRGEAGRSVFIARSSDGGRTFQPEQAVPGLDTGACGCCGMKVFMDSRGTLFLSYRGANESGSRDQVLLAGPEGGSRFKVLLEDPWKVSACPMSSTSWSESGGRILGAWETRGKVCWIAFGPHGATAASPVPPPTQGRNPKHPIAVGNSRGETLLAWTEGTGWARGGDIAWQRFDSHGKPLGEKGTAPGVPRWSLVAATADPDGGFVLIY